MAGMAALQYKAESFDPRQAKMMGRQVASRTFLEAWVSRSGANPLTGWGDTEADRVAFLHHVAELGPTAPICSATFADVGPLRAAGALWLGDPGLARRSWHRRWYDQRGWSLVGITHTIASHAAMSQIADLVHAPVQEWDALICTSRAAREAVQTILEAEADYLRLRTGSRHFTFPKLPVIPLGVDCDALKYDPETRARTRDRLGISDGDVAILQFGRLALHAKAHPVPLYIALREASARLSRPVHLILAGQFPTAGQEDDYRQLAEQMKPTVLTHFVDGADEKAGEVRAAADIGTLLSDNIQETFGLAPLELMAAGLPVVGSDWDGLRDTIDHGVTGFRIDTTIPPVGVGEYLAVRYGKLDTYDGYIGGVAQSVAIDVGQAADAFEALARDPDLRRRMGRAGQARAIEHFDWSVVIKAYRELLEELQTLRHSDAVVSAPRAPGSVADPRNMDPFRTFAAHATGALTLETPLTAGLNWSEGLDGVAGGASITRLHGPALPTVDSLETLRVALTNSPIAAGALCKLLPSTPPGHVMAGIAWLLKFGIAKVANETMP